MNSGNFFAELKRRNAYFAEGVQDEILTRLAKVADLKVISRTSTQRFKSAPSDLRDDPRYNNLLAKVMLPTLS